MFKPDTSDFIRKYGEWFAHSVILVFVLAERWLNHYRPLEEHLAYGVYQTLFLLVTLVVPFYINTYLLIPGYFNRRHWRRYLLLLMLMILCSYIVRGMLAVALFEVRGQEYILWKEFLHWAFKDFDRFNFDRFIFGPTAWILWLSFSYRLVRDWITHEQVKATLLAEKTALELAFIKAQVNPHFLFNTLNTIYATALTENAPKTAEGVARISSLMRYSLHDAQENDVLLMKEFSYIEEYVSLQRMRIGVNNSVDFEMTVADDTPDSVRIAPMMIIPLIENAFKHGLSSIGESYIKIRITVIDRHLCVLVQNKSHTGSASECGGVGLLNLRKRLAHLYPDKHDLSIDNNGNKFSVTLKIKL
jgi:two-component system, LytTR family, sensor kinase